MRLLEIAVPSYRRGVLMPRLLAMLPTATIVVPDHNVSEYQGVVPASQLKGHPPLGTIGAVRDWIVMDSDAMCVCEVDDDLEWVASYAWPKPRKISDPAGIRRILENMAQMLIDLDLPLGGFGTAENPMYYQPNAPIVIDKPVFEAIVINRSWYGRDDGVRYEVGWGEHEDGDLSMQSFLHGRTVLKDTRFQFSFVNVSMPGGMQVRRTSTSGAEHNVKAKAKWKGYLNMPLNDDGSLSNRDVVRYAVNRKSPLATHK